MLPTGTKDRCAVYNSSYLSSPHPRKLCPLFFLLLPVLSLFPLAGTYTQQQQQWTEPTHPSIHLAGERFTRRWWEWRRHMRDRPRVAGSIIFFFWEFCDVKYEFDLWCSFDVLICDVKYSMFIRSMMSISCGDLRMSIWFGDVESNLILKNQYASSKKIIKKRKNL